MHQQEAEGRLRRLGMQQGYRSCRQRTCLRNKLHEEGVNLSVRNNCLVQKSARNAQGVSLTCIALHLTCSITREPGLATGQVDPVQN